MNEHSKELCHWAIGEKVKNHKYIAREKGKKLGSYVYFYDKDKWQSWKNKASDSVKNAAKTAATATKNAASNYAKDWKSGAGMIKSSAKEYGKLWKQGAGIKSKEEKRMEPKYDEPIGPSKYKKGGPTQRMTNQADQHVSDAAKKPVERKWIGKATTKDGKTKYFYNKEDVNNWIRIQRYQHDEPDFMKGIKEIEPDIVGKTSSVKKDSSATNPDYTKNKNATVNCWHCSTVYDLRKRGYDVSAKPIQSEFGSTDLDEFYDCKCSSSTSSPKASSTEELIAQKYINEARYKKSKIAEVNKVSVEQGELISFLGAEDNKGSTTNIIPAKAIASYAKTKISTSTDKSIKEIVNDTDEYGKAMAASINKTIEAYPNDSWGRIGLHWNGFNGGHSIVWEKDSSGGIKFIDAQTNNVINIEDYASKTEMLTSIQVQRTDNLQIKKKVLDYVSETDGRENQSKFKDKTSNVYN